MASSSQHMDVNDMGDDFDIETNDSDALRGEIVRLQRKVRGAQQAREQVRKLNEFVANLQSQLDAANATVSLLKANETKGEEEGHDYKTAYDELLVAYKEVEGDLEQEREEFEELAGVLDEASKAHAAEKAQWEQETEALRLQMTNSASGKLQAELERKVFQLAKEKEVVAELYSNIEKQRKDMEELKEKHQSREQTLTDNHTCEIRDLQCRISELKQQMERQAERAPEERAEVVERPEVSPSTEPLGKALCEVERAQHDALVRRLHLQLMEARMNGFAVRAVEEPKVALSPLCGEVDWITNELLGQRLPDGRLEVLDFTNEEKRKISVRAMFRPSFAAS